MAQDRSDAPAPKRARLGISHTEHDDQFMAGAIRRVSLHNFVTYTDCEFYPGPGLNLVFGPNGSGKSSIVCALCLGLGGSTSSLGRADKLGDFVKRGCQAGYTEIELYTPLELGFTRTRTIIRRNFTVEGKTSWLVDKEKSTPSNVKIITNKLNIQVDNLCQFLAQEKVTEFANLEPCGLLRDTEKAAGSGQLWTLHDKIVSLRKSEIATRHLLQSQESSLHATMQQAKALQVEVQNLKERETWIEKIDILKKKKPWLRFRQLKSEAQRLNVVRQAAETELAKLEAEQQPLRNKVLELQRSLKDAEQESKQLRVTARQFEDRQRKIRDTLSHQDVEMDDLDAKFTAVDRQMEDRELEIRSTKNSLSDFRNRLDQIPSQQEAHDVLERLRAEDNRLYSEKNHKQLSLQDIAAQSAELKRQQASAQTKLNAFKNVEANRRRALFGNSNDGKDANQFLHWLDNEGGRAHCKEAVHGPVGLALQFNVPGTEKYVEHAMPYSQRLSFIVSCDEDWTFLSNQRKKMNLTVHINTTSRLKFSPPCDLPSGAAWLASAYTAPTPVCQYMNAFFGFHQTAYSLLPHFDPKSVLANSEKDKTSPRRIYLPKSLHSISFSRYGQRLETVSVEQVREARNFSSSADEGAMRQLQTELDDINMQLFENEPLRSKSQSDIIALDREIQAISREKSDLMQKTKSRNMLSLKVRQKEAYLNELLHQIDSTAAKANIQKEQIHINKLRLKNCVDLSHNSRNLTQAIFKYDASSLSVTHLKEILRTNIAEVALRDRLNSDTKKEVEIATAQLKQAAREAKNAKNEAANQAPIEEYRERFDQSWVPRTLDEINNLIIDFEARANSVVGDSSVINRYKELTLKLNELTKMSSDNKIKHASQEEEIMSIRNQWIKDLKEVVTQIDRQYGLFFRQFHCEGRVKLMETENEANYGISVLVKFRKQATLQQLNPNLQSGGERSVATMLYLLSLQSVTQCPFRVVDEINQGMDAINERNIFDQIVKCSDGKSMPQIFCITPKLLPNLEFTSSITVLCVFNGIWNLPQSEVNLQKIVAKKNSN